MRSLRSGIMSKEKRKKTLYALDFTGAGFEAVALAVEYGVISTRTKMNPQKGDIVVLTGTDSGGRKYVNVFVITKTIEGPDEMQVFVPVIDWAATKMMYGDVLLNQKGQRISKLHPSDSTFEVGQGGMIEKAVHSGLYSIHTGRLFN